MKKIFVSAIIACAVSAPIVSGQEKPAPVAPAVNMDMAGQMGRMQEKMQAMQAQMDRIQRTTDATERRQLMQEHMQAMQLTMTEMRGMGGPLMKGRGEHGAIMMCGNKGGMTDGDMIKCRELMENRVDIMQMMMEQMIQREQVLESMPRK